MLFIKHVICTAIANGWLIIHNKKNCASSSPHPLFASASVLAYIRPLFRARVIFLILWSSKSQQSQICPIHFSSGQASPLDGWEGRWIGISVGGEFSTEECRKRKWYEIISPQIFGPNKRACYCVRGMTGNYEKRGHSESKSFHFGDRNQ